VTGIDHDHVGTVAAVSWLACLAACSRSQVTGASSDDVDPRIVATAPTNVSSFEADDRGFIHTTVNGHHGFIVPASRASVDGAENTENWTPTSDAVSAFEAGFDGFARNESKIMAEYSACSTRQYVGLAHGAQRVLEVTIFCDDPKAPAPPPGWDPGPRASFDGKELVIHYRVDEHAYQIVRR
jgi:hypothetical protein